MVVLIAGFAVFNLNRLGSRAPAPAATPGATSSPAATASPSAAASPSPTSSVVTPGPVNPPPAGSWQTVAGLSVARAGATGTILPNGHVLIVGGVADTTVAGTATSSVEIYDPTKQTFSAGPSLSIGRAGHTATVLPDGRVLVIGGYGQLGSRSTSSVEIYDPATNQWSTAAPMTYGRSGHAAVLLADGRVMVIGGGAYPAAGISPHGSAAATLPPEIYDPAHDAWTTVAAQRFDRPVDPTATLLQNGRVLVVGGQYMWNSPDEDTERSEVYDVARNQWTDVAPDPRFPARQFQTATLLPDGRVLIAGGMIDLQPTAAAALYDPATNSWLEVARMNHARCGQGAALLLGNRVVVIGSACWTSSSATVEEFDPISAHWYDVAALHGARGGAVTVILLDGTVLSAGGVDSGGASRVVEVFKAS